jgi:uncharacterized protein
MKDDNAGSNRQLNIKFSEDKLEAYISIVYSSNPEQNYPPKFSVAELKNELSKVNVIYGLIEENIKKCSQEEKVQEVLIAKGYTPINGEDDILSIKFEVDSDLRKLNEDSKGRVDFKSIGAVNSVLKGEIIAALIPGKEGTSGKDVTGNPIKPKARKVIKLKASQGCELLNENTIVASIDGKPSMKNNTFYVYKTHQVAQDVDLKTGNIGFLGDIVIQGSVREGMKVYSGNSITIMQNVDRADIKGKGDIIIKGNVIGSNIVGGGEDSEKLSEIENLNELQNLLKEMIAAIEEIKKFNLLGYDINDGQIIKLLLENKFKAVPKLCMLLIPLSLKNKQRGDLGLEEILNFVKTKLLGLSSLNIKHYSEFFSFLDLIKERLEALNDTLSIPVNVKISYCQDAEISSSGDIIISGRGAYVSHIKAHHNVYFTQLGSTVRGGSIKAGNELKCKQVGSSGGVVTSLYVGEKGHIWIDTAYENTMVSIGSREFVIDFASKNVHAYLDDRSDIVVDRLKL